MSIGKQLWEMNMNTLWLCLGELEHCTEESPCKDCCAENGHMWEDEQECTLCQANRAEECADDYYEGER